MDRLQKCGSVRMSLTIEGKGLFSTDHTLAHWFENTPALKCAAVQYKPSVAQGNVGVCEFPDFLLSNYSRCEGGETS